MTSGRWLDSLGAWLLVLLGCLLLITGTVTLVDALVDRAWAEAAVTTLVLVFISFGTARGLRQLRHGRGARPRNVDDR